MATQPTNLPVPSESYRDLKYNAGKIDEFVTSLTLQYIDRFGNAHYTIEGLRWLAQQAIAQYGWIPVGTFQDGATLTTPNQILKDETDGEYYRWDGAFPKLVPSGSTPSTSGGTGVGAWLSVGDSTLRAMLAAPGGDKLIGSSWGGGSVWDDYAAKKIIIQAVNIYPTMSNAEINVILASGGTIYFNSGTYTVTSATETFKLGQNSRVYFHPNALLSAGADGVTVLRASSQDVGSSFIRNCKVFDPRISLVGFKNCTGINLYNARNNTEIIGPWIDMGLGDGNTGALIDHWCYGVRFYDSEVLNGGVGSSRIIVRNGANAITIKDHVGYSSDHSGTLPDYGIVVFNGMNGDFNFPDGSDLWPTACVNITGGYSQNTSRYGLLESGVSTFLSGMYFERNAISDVSLRTGSYYFTSQATHHSLNVGESCFRSSGANHATIGPFNPADRSIGQYNFPTGSNCHADGSKMWGTFLDTGIGVTDGLRLDIGAGSVKQYSSTTLPIKIREGFRCYFLNVTSGMNITTYGSPYDGQQITLILRGSSITSLLFAGVNIDVTGANTTQTKTASVIATYWAAIGKWTLTMTSWTASS
ncbi:TPA: phage tail protein [Enterobacter hormaechei subsp. xiangfangensis]|nr:phage tail protein [Enterobacter hormaechei subsp. xiangfangensis]